MENSLVLPFALFVTCFLLLIKIPVPNGAYNVLRYLGDISFTWYLVHNNIGFSIITYLCESGVISTSWLLVPCLSTFMLAILLDLFTNIIINLFNLNKNQNGITKVY